MFIKFNMLQQYLPLAVLKLNIISPPSQNNEYVATVLTACGIETQLIVSAKVKVD